MTGKWKDRRILGHKERSQEGIDNFVQITLYIVVGLYN